MRPRGCCDLPVVDGLSDAPLSTQSGTATVRVDGTRATQTPGQGARAPVRPAPDRQGVVSTPTCGRRLGDREQPVRGTLPPLPQEPALSRRHRTHLRRRDAGLPRGVRPALEPPRRRERIHAPEPTFDRLAMAPRVLQHIAQRMAGLRRRGEDLEVIAVVEHRAGPPEVAVEPACDADRPALDAARQLAGVAGLADQVDVVALDLSLIHISEPTRLLSISYAVFCLKKKK